jgi:energy-converting hydrogenase A subunit M
VKEVLLEKGWLLDVLMKSKCVFTGALREVHETGEAIELDLLRKLDDDKANIAWFPEMVNLIGKNIIYRSL